ncbi:MAG: hypothetical protein ABJE47_06865 [bacterium]
MPLSSIERIKLARDREVTVQQLRGYVIARQRPRLRLAGIVAGAGAAGFLSSVGLLTLGLRSMPIRYGLACGIGYGVLLLGLRWWIAIQAPGHVIADAVPEAGTLDARRKGSAKRSHDDGEWVDHAFFAGDIVVGEAMIVVVPFVAIVALVAAVLGVVGVVSQAPTLFAELLLDGVIAGAAYRRLRYVPPGSWLKRAVQRTVKPVLWVMALVVGLGVGIQWFYPGVASLGELFR